MNRCEFDKCSVVVRNKGYSTGLYLCKKHSRVYRYNGNLFYTNESTKGWHGTSEYIAWINMRVRCRDTKHPQYRDYGGRGIRVCERWDKSFMAFIEDVGEKPDASLTLDRIDNDGDYEPGNVRWASREEQIKNRRVSDETQKYRKYIQGKTGVYFDKKAKKYRARVNTDKTQTSLGSFDTEWEARQAVADFGKAKLSELSK